MSVFSSSVMPCSFSSAAAAYWRTSRNTRFMVSRQRGWPIISLSRYTTSSANTSVEKAAQWPSGRMCARQVETKTFWCVVSSSSTKASLLGRS